MTPARVTKVLTHQGSIFQQKINQHGESFIFIIGSLIHGCITAVWGDIMRWHKIFNTTIQIHNILKWGWAQWGFTQFQLIKRINGKEVSHKPTQHVWRTYLSPAPLTAASHWTSDTNIPQAGGVNGFLSVICHWVTASVWHSSESDQKSANLLYDGVPNMLCMPAS